MTAPRGAAFAAAERMIDRVHRHAAIVRHATQPALATGLADRDVHVVRIRHRTDRSLATPMDETLLARIEAENHVFLVAADDLGIGTGRARELPALADLELDIVHDGADRHVADRHGVAGLHVDMLAGHDGVALAEALRRQDVGQFAVAVLDQRDEAAAVRIVFDTFDAGRLVVLGALEVDRATRLFVAAPGEAPREAPVIVAPAGADLAGGERLDGLALIDRGAVPQHKLALARRR